MAWLAPWSTVLPSLAAFAVFGASARACLLCFTSYEERLQICQIFAGLDSPDLGKCEEAFADAFKGLLDTEISEEIIPCSPASSRGGGAPGVGGGRDPRGLERLRGMRCRDGRMETWGAEIGDRGMTTSGMWCQGKQFSPSPCLPLPDYEERGQLHDAFTQMTHSLQEMATAQGEWGGVRGSGIWMSECLWGGWQGRESPECDSDLDGRMPRELGDLVREQKRAGPGGVRAEGT